MRNRKKEGVVKSLAKTIRMTVLVAGLLFVASLSNAQDGLRQPASERLGIYHWFGQTPGLGQTPEPRQATASEASGDGLSRAVGDIERFGFRTVRIFVGGRYDYLHPLRSPHRFAELQEPVTLAKILALPRYKRILENPQFKTMWLTAYPVFHYGEGPDEIDLRRPVAEHEWQQEYQQLREMVEWLYRNFGGLDKVILISNHEADEKLLEALNSAGRQELAVDNVVRDLDTRFRAVADGRREFPAARLKVFSGVEVSLWRLQLGRTAAGNYAKQATGMNALGAVLPRLSYDFVSFSAWETVAQSDVAAVLSTALEEIEKRTQSGLTIAGREFFGPRHVLLGEFGYAREWKLPQAAVAKGIHAVLKLLDSGQLRYAVYWQLYDNAAEGIKQFGLLDPGGEFTCAGEVLMTYLREEEALPTQVAFCRSEMAEAVR